MKDKDDKKQGEPAPESNSQELFEEIFKQATMEIKIEKEPKAHGQKYSPILAPGRWQQQQQLKDTEERVLKPSEPAPRKSEKAQGSLPGKTVRAQPSPKYATKEDKSTRPPERKPKTDKRNVKRSIGPKTTVLVLLLAMLTGIIASYLFGGLDIPLLLDYFRIGREQVVVQVPDPGKKAATPPEKVIVSSKQPQEKEQNPAKIKDEPKEPSPAPAQASSPVGVKEDKTSGIERPSAVAQETLGTEQVKDKVPSASLHDRTNASEIAVKQESQPERVQTEPSSRSNAPGITTSHSSPPKYPYSVYLGSFKAVDAVKKAMSEYQGKGLSPYWAKVDLGEKGMWFRFFAGYFQTKEEAEKFIKDRNIQDASLGITRYANLIGIYSSDKEVGDNTRALVSAGFYPYVIKGPDGRSFLYSGAFDRKEYAEKERIVLSSKGIKTETIER